MGQSADQHFDHIENLKVEARQTKDCSLTDFESLGLLKSLSGSV